MAANVLTKKARGKKHSQEFISKVELLRMKVAAAELNWKQAKEHAKRAKRRRKLARLMARRAKTGAKQAKQALAKAREALALAESKAMSPTPPIARRQPKKAPRMRAASKASPTPQKRISKAVRLIRTPEIAEPVPATVLAVVQDPNERLPQSSPAIPGANPGQS